MYVGIGFPELLIVAMIIFLLFAPNKIPNCFRFSRGRTPATHEKLPNKKALKTRNWSASRLIDLAMDPLAPASQRIGALVQLAIVGNCNYLSELSNLALNDPDENIRAQAVIALNACHFDEVTRLLAQILAQDFSLHVRCSAAIALGAKNSELAVNALLLALLNPSENFHVYAYSIRSLLSLTTLNSALEGLKSLLVNPSVSDDVRNCSQMALNFAEGSPQPKSLVNKWERANSFQKILKRSKKSCLP